ncbi:MAG: DUF6526 family protein [Planctomycetes bacterium]|nr:DUF6526 family protein [Planctomycetota bacterium]
MAATQSRPQSYENHRVIPPIGYILAGLVLTVEAGHRAWTAAHERTFWSVWAVLVALAFLVVWWTARRRAQVVQDRLIRHEMRTRLERVLGPTRRADIARIQLAQLVALRFASDAELPALVDEVLKHDTFAPKAIKQRVRDWQADWLRV